MNMLTFSFDGLQLKDQIPLLGNSNNEKNIIDNDYDFNDFLILKHKNYAGFALRDKKAKTNTLFAQEIDNGGKLAGSMKKLSNILSESRRRLGAFDIYPSEDSTKILIVNNPPFDKYANEKFGFKIFDENLKELSNLEVTFPYKDKNFSVADYILAKDGVIYMLARIEIPRDKKEKGEADYYCEIISVNANGKGEVTEYEVKLPQKYITDVSFRVLDKDIVCSGFYNNIETRGASHDEINGIFYLKIDKKTKTISAKGVKDLDKEFVADLTTKRKANKGRGISNNFELTDFIKKDNGGAILVAEESYMYVTQTCNTNGQCTYVYHYVRGNIIAINVEPTGNIKWYVNIPKHQSTVNDYAIYSSYMLAVVKDKIYFVYNDNPKNMDPGAKSDKLKAMTNPRGALAVLVTLSENAKVEKKTLFSNKENKMTLMPSKNVKISKTEFIAPAVNRGIYCCMIPFKKGKYNLLRFDFK